ncbi:unnamed protein product [Coffea canephora]|uniref:Uncharacterized protein n=1 Tax=Coffea canephora TaxID=49390 RepID=A0A068UZ91_COFCA|nr:unnamed protein product [Coffea canephora]
MEVEVQLLVASVCLIELKILYPSQLHLMLCTLKKQKNLQ